MNNITMVNTEGFKIDEKDRKILIELQKNSRASFSEIGKIVKLPKTVVAYRIKRLVDSGFLNLFCTIINKEKLDYIYARLFLKFQNFNEEIENKLLEFLKKKQSMHWVASLNGCYDFGITILAKNIKELNNIYSEIVYKFSKYILDKELSIATEMHYYSFKYIFGDKKFIKEEKNIDKNFKPDRLDFKIINLIKQNSRLPLLDISDTLNITPQTVRTRIKQLEKNNILQGFRIRVEHKMLGFHHFHTFLNLSSIDKDKEKQIINFIESFPSTIHIIKGTGRYDLEFESLLKSHFELYELIAKIKNQFPQNIQHSDFVLIYKIHDINTVRYGE